MFHSARIKLTLWYLAIIMLISLMFSGIIYKVAISEVTRFDRAQRIRFERRMNNLPTTINFDTNNDGINQPKFISNIELIQEVRQRIFLSLVTINSFIFFISGLLGYVLAGRTLYPIQKMVEEQNRFISDASHELKTPLTSLKTAMEVFLREKKPLQNQARVLIKESIVEVDRLHDLSEALLTLSQYDHNGRSHKFEIVSLVENIDLALSRLKAMATKKNIKIIKSMEKLQIQAEPESLSQVWTILLDNAIKYSPDKSKVYISTKRQKNHIEVTIQDEGNGIDKNSIKQIFERFYRADDARNKQKNNGFGLGLSIAKQIVELHNGKITVSSKLKKGTIFTVKLPINMS